jgi:hypothetical protein
MKRRTVSRRFDEKQFWVDAFLCGPAEAVVEYRVAMADAALAAFVERFPRPVEMEDPESVVSSPMRCKWCGVQVVRCDGQINEGAQECIPGRGRNHELAVVPPVLRAWERPI